MFQDNCLFIFKSLTFKLVALKKQHKQLYQLDSGHKMIKKI